VRDVEQAREFVQLGKYPPLGRRGVSTTTAGAGFTLGADPQQTLREADAATHLMVMFESDEGYEALDAILEVEGIDMVTVGANDWATSLGLFGDEAKAHLAPKIERVFTAASHAGKITSFGASSPQEASYYYSLGVRVFFMGVDIAIKRKGLTDALAGF
jgi:4-hydroxy-2-oxoheptanedioate aldolase